MRKTALFSSSRILILLCAFTLAACSSNNSSPQNANESNEPANDLPLSQPEVTDFKSTYFSQEEIKLDGSRSYDFDGDIVSYQWSQVTGPSQLVFSSPNEADTTFIAPINSTAATYVIQLEVVDNRGDSGTASVTVNIEPTVNCASCTQAQLITLSDAGVVNGSRYGQLAAIDAAVLAITNQVTNKIEFLDLASGNITKEIQLNSAPDQLFFQSNRRLLYVSLVGTTAIAQINVDTDQIQTLQTSGMIGSMTGGADRVYYSLQNQFPNTLYSLGFEGDEQSHGSINGNLVAYNANLNEIIDAESDSSGGSLNRSRFLSSGQLERVQTADPDSNGFLGPVYFAKNISLSPNGLQMAIAASSDNGNTYPILDIPPENVQISNGAWLTEGGVQWIEFSSTGDHVITVYDSFQQSAILATVYDSTSKVRLFTRVLGSCGDQFLESAQTGFSADNQYFYTKLNCGSGFASENTSILSYTPFPAF